VNLGVECGCGRKVADEEFQWDHYHIFVIAFSFVVHEGLREEVGGSVGFARHVLHFVLVIF